MDEREGCAVGSYFVMFLTQREVQRFNCVTYKIIIFFLYTDFKYVYITDEANAK